MAAVITFPELVSAPLSNDTDAVADSWFNIIKKNYSLHVTGNNKIIAKNSQKKCIYT